MLLEGTSGFLAKGVWLLRSYFNNVEASCLVYVSAFLNFRNWMLLKGRGDGAGR